MSQLTTFIKPTPRPFVMNLLVHVNRFINFKGIRWLKYVPLVNKIPLVRGFCDITTINFSQEDEARLKSYIQPTTIAFIGPNHPEFFTDWMLDKEISARAAPLMASWATHNVVNGMGKTMQKFWLNNNLIAQIPGTGNAQAKQYSIQHAIAGHGVLLHPEGHVGWHSDKIAPLFSGIFDMALQAYQQTQGEKSVYMIPVVWKLSFNKDVTKELHKEFNYIEKDLRLNSSKSLDINLRLQQLFLGIFKHVASKYNITISSDTVFGLQNHIVQELVTICSKELNYSLTVDIATDIKALNRLAKQVIDGNVAKNIKVMLKDLNNVRDFTLHYYGDNLSQENIAEMLKKIRIIFCTKGFRNMFHKFVPIPVSSRTAYIQVLEAISINDIVEQNHTKDFTLQLMQQRMQTTLDKINDNLVKQHKVIFYKNLLNT